MRVVAVLLAACLASGASDAAAYCRSTTIKPVKPEVCSSTGVPLKWFDRCADVKLFPRAKPGLTTRQIEDVLQASFDTWSDVTCEGEPVGVVADVSVAESQSNSVWENAVLFIDDRDEWVERMNEEDAVAITFTMVGLETGRIRAADIELNDWRYNLGICGAACPSGVTDLQNALTHEVGHFYGLGHMPAGGPETMAEWAVPREINKRTLEPDDMDGICAIYPPGTFAEECTGSAFYAEEGGGCGCTTLGRRRSGDGRLPLIALVVAAMFLARSRARRRA